MSNDLYFPVEHTVSRTRSLISRMRYNVPHDEIQRKRARERESNLLSAFPCYDLIQPGAKLGQNLLTRDLFTSDN